MSVRLVTGSANALAGICNGLCTYNDLDLWFNPQYALVMILNEENKEVLGYFSFFIFQGENPGIVFILIPSIILRSLF